MLRLFKKKLEVRKTNTVQVGNKLVILDGHNDMRYLDLTNNKVHTFKPKRKPRRDD